MNARSGLRFQDAAYLAGQADFAIQEFKRALAAFRLSARRGYKVDVSLYYVGYLENVLKNANAALVDLGKVVALKDSPMRASAAFQIAEIYFEQGKKIKNKATEREYFLGKVKPAYAKVVDLGEDSSSGRDAQARIRESDAKFSTQSATATAAQPCAKLTMEHRSQSTLGSSPSLKTSSTTPTSSSRPTRR